MYVRIKLWKIKTHVLCSYYFHGVCNHQLYLPMYLKNKNANILACVLDHYI